MRHAQVGEVNQEEKEKEAMQELPESPTDLAPLPISRNKGPARCYFVMMAIVYFAFFVIAVVTLGSFGIKQAEITRYVHNLGYDDSHTCILFVKNEFSSQGVCGYVLWGLISITIVAVVWFIYSIVLAVFGPTV